MEKMEILRENSERISEEIMRIQSEIDVIKLFRMG
jgi:hypothetical protein